MGEVATEISNLSASVEEIAASADQAKSMNERARELAVDGRTAADDAIETMEVVDDATTEARCRPTSTRSASGSSR